MIDIPFAQTELDAARELLRLINPEPALADEQWTSLQALLAEEDNEWEETGLMWAFKEAVDWTSGFFVDWKDTESFVQAIDTLASLWKVSVDWGTEDALDDDFLEEHDVPALMAIAHASLQAQGMDLWSWDTDGDCYSGFLARTDDAGRVQTQAESLDVQILTGDTSF